MASAKIKVLSEMLPELRAKGSKVLLFSQWTQVSIYIRQKHVGTQRCTVVHCGVEKQGSLLMNGHTQ
jgi:hypothetical protein